MSGNHCQFINKMQDSLATVEIPSLSSLFFYPPLESLLCPSSAPLPASCSPTHLPSSSPSPSSSSARHFPASPATLHLRCPCTVVSAQSPSCTRTYTVQAGDICDSISAANNVSTWVLFSPFRTHTLIRFSYQLAVVNEGIIDANCDNLQIGASICLGWQGEDCSTTYVVQAGDDCDDVAYNWGINSTIFSANNPQLNQQCDNLYIGEVTFFFVRP